MLIVKEWDKPPTISPMQKKWAELVKVYEMLRDSDDPRERVHGAERLINLRQMNEDFKLGIPGA